MVNLKENLIKLSDYPFIYSVTGSIFVMVFQKNITPVNTSFNELIPVFIFIGIIGTLVTIIDPFGRLAKLIISITKHESLTSETSEELMLKTPNYFKRAVETTWINYEIDKLVSTFYFIIVLFSLIFISNPDHITFIFNLLV